jgi:putative transposase
MPWMETNVWDERRRFVRDAATGHWSMTELCERYEVSRPTGYKWLARYRLEGDEGLRDDSRAPQSCPHRTAAEAEQLILAARRKFGWGAKKLRLVLTARHPTVGWPARSTINSILERHGLLHKQRRRRTWTHPGAAPLLTARPNQVWPVDFKGQFKTGDGRYCYPLTVTDHFSRQVLLCHGLPSVRGVDARPLFRRLFRRVGLPEAIRSDNGAPFASTGIHGLSQLNVWWMQLGIVHQRIPPSSPQENGTHERMHRELKRETARPAAASVRAQQRRFDTFVHRYNTERPHDGIGGVPPASRWEPSPRPYPERVPSPEYPAHVEVRRVSTAGTFRLQSGQPFLSHALRGQDIGLEEVGDGIWNIVYYTTLLGRIDERTLMMTGVGPRQRV